ncbi:MAG: hypothetical protein HY589_05790, partial [Candidatus Omnitrophica bacterium]|nr:hypothetical protein [Candidatus Omnitrophota bacterium]
VEMTAAQWLDSKMNTAALQPLRGHYDLRAAQRVAFGDTDLAATEAISDSFDILAGVQAAKPTTPPAGTSPERYVVITASDARLTEKSKAIQKIRQWGGIPEVRTADDVAGLRRALAGTEGAHVIVIGNEAMAQEIGANPGAVADLQARLDSATVLFGDDFAPEVQDTRQSMQGLADNLVIAGLCLNSAQDKTAEELETDPAAAAARALLTSLRLGQGEVTITELNRIRPIPGRSIVDRLSFAAAHRFLPSVESMSPEMAAEIRTARMLALNA